MIEARYVRQLQAAGAFTAALAAVPSEDWCRNWAARRTIMLRMTSKRVREAVDKLCPPAVVRWSRSFWNAHTTQKQKKHAELNGTAAEKLAFVFRQLAALTPAVNITTIDFGKIPNWLCDGHPCRIKGQDAESFAGVLAQCPALALLNLADNQIGDTGAEFLARVLGQCTPGSTCDL
jgi:hypothetical protein